MKCGDIKELIIEYIDGSLNEKDFQKVDEWLDWREKYKQPD